MIINKKTLLELEIKKALELLEAGRKIQLEYDVKNSILKIFELKIKRIPIGGLKNEKIFSWRQKNQWYL